MKRLLLILGLLILLLVGSAIAVPFLFKGKILDLAKETANKELNATVDFSNDISLSIFRDFPNLSLGIKDLSVVGANEFEGDTLAYLGHFYAELDLMSVIGGDRIHIQKIDLEDARIQAVVLENGKANWDITKPSEETKTDTASSSSGEFSLDLQSYSFKNCQIVYDDRQSKLYAELVNFNHEGEGDFTQDDFILNTLTKMDALTFIMDGVPYANRIKTEITCNLHMNLPNMRFAFEENSFKLNALEIGLNGFVALPEDKVELDLQVDSKKTSFKEILSLIPALYTKDFENMTVSGNTALSLSAKGVYDEVLETYPAFDVALLVENATLKYPDLPEALNDIQIDLKVNNLGGSLNATKVNLNRMHFALGKEPFDLKLIMTQPMTDPYVDVMAKGRLMLDRMNKIIPLAEGTKLSGLLETDLAIKGRMSEFTGDDYEKINAQGQLKMKNLRYVDSEMPGPFHMDTLHMELSPKLVALNTMKGGIGHSDFQLKGTVSNFIPYVFQDSAILKGDMEMESRLLDINYLMGSAEEQKEEPKPEDTTSLEQIKIPANLDIRFAINRIDKVLYDNLQLTNIKGEARVKEARLDLSDVQVNAFGGAMSLNGSYDTREEAKTSMKLKLDQVDVQQVYQYVNTVQKLAPIGKYLTGKLNANLDLATVLDEHMSPKLSTLTSDGLLQTTEAVLSEFTPMTALADKLNLNSLKDIAFTNTNLSYEVKDGKVWLKKPVDFNAGPIKIKVLEDGYTTFDQLLNYKMKLDVPRSAFGSGANAVLNDLLSEVNKTGTQFSPNDIINVTALVGGTVSNPKITTSLKDLKRSAVNKVKDEVKKVIDEKKEEVKKEIKAKTEDFIKVAEAKGDALIAEAKKKSEQLQSEARKKGDALIAEADKQAQKLLDDAGNNPIKRKGAQLAGDKLKQEARDKAAKLNQEAKKQGDDLVRKAEEEKARLIAEARAKNQ